jgi:hypothetical protein
MKSRLGFPIQRVCGADESIKPRVERSGTLGSSSRRFKARETGGRSWFVYKLPPASGLVIINTGLPRVPLRSTLGFMLSSAPQTV